MNKIAVIGAGSWGTALAVTLSKKGNDVRLWSHRKTHVEEMKAQRENIKYLPKVKLDDGISIFANMEEAMDSVDLVVFAVPAQSFRFVFEKAIPLIDDNTIIVNVAKGIEKGTLMRLSQVAKILKPDVKYVALSGPSHAEEVGRFLPTTVAVASDDILLAEHVQDVFITNRFRVYTNPDLCGVEIAGALKNIIALGAGISDGIGFGDNAKAAIITRGITEMTRLGLSLGANEDTFAGLAGVGDLIVTCTSMHSRNRRCGLLIGQGISPEEASNEIGMVVEGMSTVISTYDLSRKMNVEMPITEAIYDCITGKINAKDAVDLLMERKKKNEMHI